MGRVCDHIGSKLQSFIEAQHMFFVATAPNAAGHVNVSPKGRDSFRILGPEQVAYVDFNGSGVETIAHLRENGRITVMFCAFEGSPKIVRLHGKGRVVEPFDADFDALLSRFAPFTRSLHHRGERDADCGFLWLFRPAVRVQGTAGPARQVG